MLQKDLLSKIDLHKNMERQIKIPFAEFLLTKGEFYSIPLYINYFPNLLSPLDSVHRYRLYLRKHYPLLYGIAFR